MAIRAGCSTLDVNFGDALMLVGVHRLQRLHGGAALQAGHPLAKPDDRADRDRPSSPRCPSWPPNSRCGAGILPDAQGWAVIAYTAIFPSILAQVFYISGVELIGANRAGLFINLVPIFGTLLSIVILGEAFHALPRRRHGAGARRHLAGRDSGRKMANA